jgi:hypothetical protein
MFYKSYWWVYFHCDILWYDILDYVLADFGVWGWDDFVVTNFAFESIFCVVDNASFVYLREF